MSIESSIEIVQFHVATGNREVVSVLQNSLNGPGRCRLYANLRSLQPLAGNQRGKARIGSVRFDRTFYQLFDFQVTEDRQGAIGRESEAGQECCPNGRADRELEEFRIPFISRMSDLDAVLLNRAFRFLD